MFAGTWAPPPKAKNRSKIQLAVRLGTSSNIKRQPFVGRQKAVYSMIVSTSMVPSARRRPKCPNLPNLPKWRGRWWNRWRKWRGRRWEKWRGKKSRRCSSSNSRSASTTWLSSASTTSVSSATTASVSSSARRRPKCPNLLKWQGWWWNRRGRWWRGRKK